MSDRCLLLGSCEPWQAIWGAKVDWLACRLQDFFQKECWKHHPKPHGDYIEEKKKQVGGQRAWSPVCRKDLVAD